MHRQSDRPAPSPPRPTTASQPGVWSVEYRFFLTSTQTRFCFPYRGGWAQNTSTRLSVPVGDVAVIPALSKRGLSTRKRGGCGRLLGLSQVKFEAQSRVEERSGSLLHLGPVFEASLPGCSCSVPRWINPGDGTVRLGEEGRQTADSPGGTLSRNLLLSCHETLPGCVKCASITNPELHRGSVVLFFWVESSSEEKSSSCL
ncbi:hypothetical protein WMY93_013141 [Mugilogobius chulae]|uniref:Uncharacterized protein n=1 Tax=Mugilogobius chulae TaxID=88201 RepID=A0AAW0P8C7_9GOBI